MARSDQPSLQSQRPGGPFPDPRVFSHSAGHRKLRARGVSRNRVVTAVRMASAGAVRRTLPGRFRRSTGTPGLGCSGFRSWSSLDRCYRQLMSIGACDSPFRPVTGLLSVPIAGSSQWARGSSSRLAGKSHFRAVGWGRCRHRAAVRGRKQGRAGSNACKSRAGGDSFARGFACAMSMGLYSAEPTARRSATSVGCDSYTAKRAAYLSISIPCWRLTGSRRARVTLRLEPVPVLP